MSKNRAKNEQSKAGVIRQARSEIELLRDAGVSMTSIAHQLAERSRQAITVADLYRETYRARLRRKKKGATLPPGSHPASDALTPDRPDAAPAARPAPGRASSLAERLKLRETQSIEFNPKPDADKLI